VLALGSINNWHVHQLDVNNAFLHGELNKDVYMTIPPGVQVEGSNKVCKLLKSIYGLKQASRTWYAKLQTLLLSIGYNQATADYSLFIKFSSTHFTTMLIYVDDILLVSNSPTEMIFVKTTLNQHFGIKDLGVRKYFLGLEAAHSKAGISLCQR